jgi:hypothetical protein
MDPETLFRRLTEIMERLDRNIEMKRHKGGAHEAYESLYDLRNEVDPEGHKAPAAVASFCCDAGPSLADLIAALPAGHSITIAAFDREG